MYTPMVQETFTRKYKPKQSSITNAPLPFKQRSTLFSKPKFLHKQGFVADIDKHLNKIKIKSSGILGKEMRTSSQDIGGDRDDNSNKAGMREKAVGSHEKFLLTTPGAEQVLPEGTGKFQPTTSRIIDQSQLTVSTEDSKTESSNIEISTQSANYSATESPPIEDQVYSLDIERKDWAPDALPLREQTPTLDEAAAEPNEYFISDSQASVQSEESQETQTFCLHLIDHMIQKFPNMEFDLNHLKNEVREKEEDLASWASAIQAGFDDEVWQGVIQIKNLEKQVADRGDELHTAYVRIEELQEEGKVIRNQSKSAGNHIKYLETQLHHQAHLIDFWRDGFYKQTTKLKEEKRLIAENMGAMDTRLTAAIERNNFHEDEEMKLKGEIVKLKNALRAIHKDREFYRDFYYKQKSPEEDAKEQVEQVDRVKQVESGGAGIKQATNVLRRQYVNAAVNGKPIESLSATEFHALQERLVQQGMSMRALCMAEAKVDERVKDNSEPKSDANTNTICTGRLSDDVFTDDTEYGSPIRQVGGPPPFRLLPAPISDNQPVRQDPCPTAERPVSLSDFPTPPSNV